MEDSLFFDLRLPWGVWETRRLYGGDWLFCRSEGTNI